MQPANRYIYERGCLRAGEDWLETHLVPVAGTFISAMIVQVMEKLSFCVCVLCVCRTKPRDELILEFSSVRFDSLLGFCS